MGGVGIILGFCLRSLIRLVTDLKYYLIEMIMLQLWKGKKILVEMDEILLKEEILWKKRSWLDKMRGGDRNTNYFRRKASWRAKKNHVSSLRKEDDCLTENMEEMKGIT